MDLLEYAVVKKLAGGGGASVNFYNGENLVKTQTIKNVEELVAPENPTKESTDQYDYNFLGWSLDGTTVLTSFIAPVGASEVNYYAVYSEELRYYTVRFLNGDIVLQTSQVQYGSMPIYTGDIPTADDGQAFGGWAPKLSAVTSDVDYIAQFTALPNLAYTLNSDNASYSVSGIGTVTDTDIVIPDTYGGLPVTMIAGSAFKDNTNITSVIIPDSVTVIGSMAFQACSRLTSVVMDDGVRRINSAAFDACQNLTSVVMSNNITYIGEYAFRKCKGLTSIDIPNSVTEIYLSAFEYCTGLTSVRIKDIEAWCKTIKRNETANPLYCAKNLYLNNQLVTELVIPDGVSSIYSRTFLCCHSLTRVEIPNSVTSISDKVFYDCKNCLEYDFTKHTAVPTLGSSVFYNTNANAKIIVPDALYDEWIAATNWANYASHIIKASEYTEA